MRRKKIVTLITTLILCVITIIVFTMYKPFMQEKNNVTTESATYTTEDFFTQLHNPLPSKNKVKKPLLLENKEVMGRIGEEIQLKEESNAGTEVEDAEMQKGGNKEDSGEVEEKVEQDSGAEETAAVIPPTAGANKNLSQYLNPYVLQVIKSYKIAGGRYPYLLNNDYANYNGVTTTLHYQNQELLKAHPSGNRASHCSGITFEVFFKAMQARNRQLGISPDNFNNMTWDELYDFVLTWYAAKGPKSQSNIAVAVEKYGVGQRIRNLEEAAAGDFIDISRENNTGHTAVFLEWIREGNQIIGFKYWSSQDSTRGIQYNQEYFNVISPNGKKYGNVMIDRVYVARVLPVSQYKPFK
ncbi:hypothetical protein [Clostridium formicaceticum]|uniref:Uncharacterized protein n=2 Tax=Clostridium formicaceticum TaxID=1497 RepID=A0AAC9RTL9_9CLOT|nr:hypothetical protein [Clostridium formicaceticum]AOY75241.1 hypothetical protein BJL90_04570 [Clostridium formicaceticum]ARE89675.1 hypothetical protein CLFO_41560 [Clostridium formicaceticum]